MPYDTIPVTHKFGIISESHRVGLLNRLQQHNDNAIISSGNTINKNGISATPGLFVEVSDSFVSQYNSAGVDDKKKLDMAVRKMIERLKREAGIINKGFGQHVDLPSAWTKLMQLTQCRGELQQECYNILSTSLDESPIRESQIPVLFFLAESALYQIRTEIIFPPSLRNNELSLLRVGQLAFSRLFYHHMCGSLLGGNTHDRDALRTYINGFERCLDAYSVHPVGHYYCQYMLSVGKILLGDVSEDEKHDIAISTRDDPISNKFTPAAASQNKWICAAPSTTVGASLHELAPTLWHSLDVWHSIRLTDRSFESTVSFLNCGLTTFASENWLDGVCTLGILGDAAKVNVDALTVMQDLACGRCSEELSHRHEPAAAVVHVNQMR